MKTVCERPHMGQCASRSQIYLRGLPGSCAPYASLHDTYHHAEALIHGRVVLALASIALGPDNFQPRTADTLSAVDPLVLVCIEAEQQLGRCPAQTCRKPSCWCALHG